MEKADKILVVGALGQPGKQTTEALRLQYGQTHVIATDILQRARVKPDYLPYVRLDVPNKARLLMLVRDEEVTQIYLHPTMFLTQEEQNPQLTWQLNMDRLLNVQDISVKCNIKTIVWPSCPTAF